MTYLPIARILLRYIVGALVAYGWIGAETGEYLVVDPDLALVVAGIVSAAVEGGYALAKRHGGAT